MPALFKFKMVGSSKGGIRNGCILFEAAENGLEKFLRNFRLNPISAATHGHHGRHFHHGSAAVLTIHNCVYTASHQGNASISG